MRRPRSGCLGVPPIVQLNGSLPLEEKHLVLLMMQKTGMADMITKIGPVLIDEVRWPVAYSQGFAQIRISLPAPGSPSPSVEIIPPQFASGAPEYADAD